ncbi:hypothetical protein JG636_18990, partial [Vibrio cholerae]|uniref:hypothetical protein n=1 Tax=Vibrio cholerae TaxID=666 RepID=UPI0018F0DEC4
MGALAHKILANLLQNHLTTDNGVLALTKGAIAIIDCHSSSGVTFVSNYLTENPENQREVWELFAERFVRDCLEASAA